MNEIDITLSKFKYRDPHSRNSNGKTPKHAGKTIRPRRKAYGPF